MVLTKRPFPFGKNDKQIPIVADLFARPFGVHYLFSCVIKNLRGSKADFDDSRDLIFFTTDLQTVNYYSTIHCWS